MCAVTEGHKWLNLFVLSFFLVFKNAFNCFGNRLSKLMKPCKTKQLHRLMEVGWKLLKGQLIQAGLNSELDLVFKGDLDDQFQCFKL